MAGGGKVEEEYGTARTSVWWDIENCQVPKGYDAHVIAQNMASALTAVGYKGPVTISVYGDTKQIATAVQHALSGTGITLNHVPSGVKDASDKKILVDMLFWAVDNPPPANYLLISGDRDFSYALHQLRMRRYNILLAHAPNVSQSLVSAARTVWLWTSLLVGEAPLEKQRTEQLKKRDAPSFHMDGSARPNKKTSKSSGGSSSGGGSMVKRRCQNSRKIHFGACRAAQGVCFHCQREGHFKKDCPLLVQGSGAAPHISEAGGQGVPHEQGFLVVDSTRGSGAGLPVENPEEALVLAGEAPLEKQRTEQCKNKDAPSFHMDGSARPNKKRSKSGGGSSSGGGSMVKRRCQNSGKNHFEAGRAAQGVCFHCQQEGHFKRDCPLLVQGSGAAPHISEAGGQGVPHEQGFLVVDSTRGSGAGLPAEDPEEAVVLAGEAPLEKQRTEQCKNKDAPSFHMDGSARPNKKRSKNGGGSSSGGGSMVKRRCQNSGKNHFEACRAAQGVCFHCQQEGHFKRDCPLLVQGSGAAPHISVAGGQGVPHEHGFSVVDSTGLAVTGSSGGRSIGGHGTQSKLRGQPFTLIQQEAVATLDVIQLNNIWFPSPSFFWY